jgi:hypothetical protein
MLDQVLRRVLNVLVPERLQRDPVVFVRAAVVQLLPPIYILAMWITLYGLPQRVNPPTWNLVLYASFPVLVRLFSGYKVPAWIFIAVQMVSSLYLSLRVFPPGVAYISTSFFVPFIAVVLVGRRVGLFCAMFSLLLICYSHYVVPPLGAPTAEQQVFMQMEIVRRCAARNWAMVMLTAILHRVLTFAVDQRCRDIARSNEQMFASVWCVGASVFFFFLWLISVCCQSRVASTVSGNLRRRTAADRRRGSTACCAVHCCHGPSCSRRARQHTNHDPRCEIAGADRRILTPMVGADFQKLQQGMFVLHSEVFDPRHVLVDAARWAVMPSSPTPPLHVRDKPCSQHVADLDRSVRMYLLPCTPTSSGCGA